MSNAEKMVSVPREWLQDLIAAGAGETVCLHDLEIASQALSGQPAEQHHGDTVALPARKSYDNRSFQASCVAEGWNDCLTEIAKLGPFYTHADAGGVERLSDRLKIMTRFRDEFEIKAKLLEEENEKLRSELSDAIQSLKTISNLAGRDEFMLDIDDVRQYANSRSIAASYMLSASAEPSAQVEIDERADFEAHYLVDLAFEEADFHMDGERYVWQATQDRWEAWQARAALERKP